MRVTINLLLKKSKSRSSGKNPIYSRITLDGRRTEISTGVFVDPAAWDNSRQVIKGKCEKIRIMNNRLDKFISNVNDNYNQLVALGEDFDIIDLKEKITGTKNQNQVLDIFDMTISSIEGKLGHGYSYSTLKHYRTCRRRVSEFIQRQYKGLDIPLDRINYHFLDSFDIFLKSTVKVSSNTAWGYHKDFKRVLNNAVSMNLLTQNPYRTYKVKSMESNRDFLTTDEIKRLLQKEISIERLRVVRDIFVFACYTGLSFSDIEKLGPEHLFKGNDGEKWIIIDRTKTQTTCRIPLLPGASIILSKYQDYPVNNSKRRLLPVHSNQKMNAYLKELADICGIMKTLTMHVARHTFATSVTLANGVPIETVSKILGHRSLKTTQIYARILDSKISGDMKTLKNKLKKVNL